MHQNIEYILCKSGMYQKGIICLSEVQNEKTLYFNAHLKIFFKILNHVTKLFYF